MLIEKSIAPAHAPADQADVVGHLRSSYSARLVPGAEGVAVTRILLWDNQDGPPHSLAIGPAAVRFRTGQRAEVGFKRAGDSGSGTRSPARCGPAHPRPACLTLGRTSAIFGAAAKGEEVQSNLRFHM